MKRFVQCLIVMIAVLLMSLSSARAADWKTELEAKLKEAFPLTKVSKLNIDLVTQPGAVFLIQKDGLMGDVGSKSMLPPVKVQDGAVKQPGGMTAIAISASKTVYHFKAGERLYLTDIKVGDDKIVYSFLSADSYSIDVRGSSQQEHYRGEIEFDYPKSALPSADVAKLQKDFETVVLGQAKATEVQTKTVSLGQTMAEVEAILGKPDTKVNLGTKVTYIYKTMKVIFTDGKVTDVQ